MRRNVLIFLFTLIILSQTLVAWGKNEGRCAFDVAKNGDVFLLIPSSTKKIHHVNQRGIPIKRFGDEGPSEKQLLFPVDMILWKEKLYVLDLFGPQIKVFSTWGKHIESLCKDLPEDQRLKKPLMMRIKHDDEKESDFIYVLDIAKRLVMIYTLDGKFEKGIALSIDYEKYFDWITSFNIDEKGNLWFTSDSAEDIALRHVLIFDDEGLLVNEHSLSKVERGGFLTDIIPLTGGDFLLVDSAGSASSIYTGGFIFLDSKGEPTSKKEIYDSIASKFYSPLKVKLWIDGFYVLISEKRLLQINSDFEILRSWSLE